MEMIPMVQQRRFPLVRAYIQDCHSQEFLAGKPVGSYRRIIHGDKAQARAVINPHGIRIGGEEELLLVLGLLAQAHHFPITAKLAPEEPKQSCNPDH
jgi:hypothetical protein